MLCRKMSLMADDDMKHKILTGLKILYAYLCFDPIIAFTVNLACFDLYFKEGAYIS